MAFLPVQQLEISSCMPFDPTLEYRVNNGQRHSAPRYIKPLRQYELVYKGLGTASKILIERFVTQTQRFIMPFEFLHPYGYTITNATNASPIVITTQHVHDFLHNDQLVISGISGNTNANGTHMITDVANATFTLLDSTGNGAFSDPDGDAKAQLYLPRVKIVTSNESYTSAEKILGPNKNDYGVFFLTIVIEELL